MTIFAQNKAEAGTAEAYRFFLISIEVMYKMGAAIWLNRLLASQGLEEPFPEF